MPNERLTEAEIAELQRLHSGCIRCSADDMVALGHAVYGILPRLLDEVTHGREQLKEVALCGVEFEDVRIRYVTAQIDRKLWLSLQAEYATKGAPNA